jgi:hypothetical protein
MGDLNMIWCKACKWSSVRSRIQGVALLLLITCFGLGNASAATTYYVANGGLDTNNGTSKSTPWLHAPGMTGCGNTCAGYSPAPGDQIIFKGGDTWHYSAGSPVGLPWTFSFSGSSGNNIYVGVDMTWFDGSSWSRPVLTMDNPISSTIVSSCTFDDTSKQAVVISGSHVTFDNFEFTGKCWNGDPFAGSLNISSGRNLLIEHNYFHGWSAATGSVDTHYMILGVTSAVTTNNEISYNVIDGSDTFHGTTSAQCPGTFNGPPCSIGFGIYGDSYNLHDNVLNNLSNGVVSNNFSTVNNNLFENMWNSYDGKTHPNVVESGAAALPGVPLYFYNNVLKNTHQNVTYWPMFDTVAYEFNNVFFENDDGGGGTNVNCFMQSPATNSSKPVAYIYNNTFVGDDTTCQFNFFVGNSATPTWKGTANYQNNHFIVSATTLSAMIYCAGPAACTTTDNGHEIFQTVTVANGQGYMATNSYQPTANSNATVGAGANLTSFCATFSPDSALCTGTSGGVSEGSGNVASFPGLPLAMTSRPPSTAWNAGAYQSGPHPPIGLTATVH